MGLKFNLTYNTPTDWVKAVTAGITAFVAAFGTIQPGGVTAFEWVGVVVTALTAFLTVLGVYSAADHQEAPIDREPVTFQADNTARALEEGDATNG